MSNRRTFLKFCVGGLLGGTVMAVGLQYYRRKKLLKIVEHPSPLLRRASRPVERIDDKLITLSKFMTSTLRYEAMLEFFSRASLYKGLAAPQVGHHVRMIVCGLNGEVKVLINPEIIEKQGTYASKEFCLSLPGHKTRTVERPDFIKVRHINLDGSEATLTAQASSAALISHEIDHLDGILYIDHQK